VLADVLSFVLFATIARAFGPAGTGEYSYAFALASIAALIATSGFEEFGIRQYVSATPQTRASVWHGIVSAQSAQLALALCGLAIFLLLGGGREARLTVILELTFFLVAWTFGRTVFVPAMAAQAMAKPAFTDLACRLAAIALGVTLVLTLQPPLPVVLIGFPLAGIVYAGIALRTAASHGAPWHFQVRWREVRATWQQTAPFAGSELLNQFYVRADMLLIASMLGTASVGLYATDVKFVEVGTLPLVMFGTAMYPILSTLVARHSGDFPSAARDLVRVQFMLSGWLAVGIALLVPHLLMPIFGSEFEPAAKLLPWFAALALVKGAEIAFYRLLYCVHAQGSYFKALVIGTVLILLLNVALIPRFGLFGAIVAGVVSTLVVVLLCARVLSRHLPAWMLLAQAGRLLAALVVTAAVVHGVDVLDKTPWPHTAVGCLVFPFAAAACGLLPNPWRSRLFSHTPMVTAPESVDLSRAQLEASVRVGPEP
jgi:O-antigen/teichoic acid export membrane protein